jgi:glycerate kinase
MMSQPADPGTVLVAPDSFKGTLSAGEVAEAVAAGLRSAGLTADICPIADGGEGTLDALLMDGERHRAVVSDPLGRPVEAEFGLRGDIGIVDTAAASGLGLVAPADRDAIAATTFGTGELIAAAVAAGARTVYLGVGGSATTDGGAGAVAALEASGGLHGARLIVLCDVRTPFEDAARVFAAQKGASPAQIEALSGRLHALAASYPIDPRGVPSTGAAGGLSGGLYANYGAELVAGAGFVLDAVDFDRRCRAAIAVVTGEGKLDDQSRAGKAVSHVAARARAVGRPCYAIVGTNALDNERAGAMGIDQVVAASTLDEISQAAAMLARSLVPMASAGG